MYPENPEGTQEIVQGFYIRHCQESYSQPVPPQTRPYTTIGHSDESSDI